MSRSAIDATRFTATAPHAYTKPTAARPAKASNTLSPSSHPRFQPSTPVSHPPPGGQPGPIETPAQKVARLRAAHARQKASEFSQWDRIVVRGRQYADVAHRTITYSLIAFTGVAAVVTFVSLADMIMWNRRKRNEFYQEQHNFLQIRLMEARKAVAEGIADDDQLLLLNRERAAEEAEEARKNKKGVWKSITGIFSTEGLKIEEGTTTGSPASSQTTIVDQIAPAGEPKDQRQDTIRESNILQAVEEKRREGERVLEGHNIRGGPLDQLAEQAVEAGRTKSGGWRSWISSK